MFFHCDDELSDEASLLPRYRDFGVLGSGFDIAGRVRAGGNEVDVGRSEVGLGE